MILINQCDNFPIGYIGHTIQLYPSESQKVLITRLFGVCRYVYNWSIDTIDEYYKQDNHPRFPSKYTLNNIFTRYKHEDANKWLLQFNSTILKGAIFTAHRAFILFFDKINGRPKYKSKRTQTDSFYVRPERISINPNNTIFVPGIGLMRCGNIPDANMIGTGNKGTITLPHKNYYNARVHFDGVHYSLSIFTKIDETSPIACVVKNIKPNSNSCAIGIDLGCGKNNWIVDSNGEQVHQPDIYKTAKRLKRLQSKLNRQRNAVPTRPNVGKMSKNSIKTREAINKCYQHIHNKRMNTIHNYVSHSIIAKNPEYVVIEDIRVNDIINKYQNDDYPKFVKNRLITNALNSMMYTIQQTIIYKCAYNDIPVYKADKEFPSTKRCNTCGSLQEVGKHRVFRCKSCGARLNRDLNAAYNLRDYPILNY